jgi:multisubunit Na+/H+ antiporter MnhB subunit
MGKMTVTLGNPLLIFVWSLAMLMLGCAIGIYWKATPGMAFCLVALGAVLMVIHDMAMGLLWFAVTAKMVARIHPGKS